MARACARRSERLDRENRTEWWVDREGLGRREAGKQNAEEADEEKPRNKE